MGHKSYTPEFANSVRDNKGMAKFKLFCRKKHIVGNDNLFHGWLQLSTNTFNHKPCENGREDWRCECNSNVHYVIIPPLQRRSWKKGILVSPCPSVRLWTESCPLCIFHNISRIHFIFKHQLTSEGVSRFAMFVEFENFKFWQFI